jgi:16S rRNA (cytidine1402-2'-O)-methyltransferase
VADAAQAGNAVLPVPGPSAVTAALSASGLVDGPYVFLGFLPRGGTDRRRLLARAGATGFALVLFEAPGRVTATLIDLEGVVGDRPAAIMRELTKLHEDVRRGRLSTLRAALADEAMRGEVVIVVAAATEEAEDAEDPRAVMSRLLAVGMKPSEAAREAAAITGRPRSELYALARDVGRPSPERQSG